jgi:hypothetical protein
MRKTIAFVVFLFVFNPVLFGQTVKPDEKIISFRATDMALKDALNLLALKTDVNISYNNTDIPTDSLITIVVYSKPLGRVIDQLLQGTYGKYQLVKNQIAIYDYRNEKDFSSNNSSNTGKNNRESSVNGNNSISGNAISKEQNSNNQSGNTINTGEGSNGNEEESNNSKNGNVGSTNNAESSNEKVGSGSDGQISGTENGNNSKIGTAVIGNESKNSESNVSGENKNNSKSSNGDNSDSSTNTNSNSKNEIGSSKETNSARKSRELITISGYLIDENSGEKLVYGNVALSDYTKGTISNEYGFYSFTLPKDSLAIEFSYLGYESVSINDYFTRDTVININLSSEVLLNEILITDTRLKNVDQLELDQYEISSVDVLPFDKINSLVSLGGEPDVIRLAHMMPGVNTGADGFGGMNIRGGTIDQNLILFDGVPIYNANHGLGIFSIFNTSTIKSAKLYKGAFPARFEGRLSSVLDIRTREGNKKKLSGDLSIGLLTAKATIEGPIGKSGENSFLFSARRTFIDPWINATAEFLNESNSRRGSTSYRFYDLNGKIDLALNSKNRLFISYYKGNDSFENEASVELTEDGVTFTESNLDDWDWGNDVAVVRVNTEVSNKFFLNTSLYYTKYNFDSFGKDRFKEIENNEIIADSYLAGIFNSNIEDLGLRFDMDYIPRPEHYLKIGFAAIRHKFSPNLVFVTTIDDFVDKEEVITKDAVEARGQGPQINGTELQLYIEDEIKLSSRTKVNVGLHNSAIITENKTFFFPQPRISFLSNRNRYYLKGSLSFMSQYLQLLTNSGLGVPADLWLPSTEKLNPQKGWIATLGFGKKIKSGSIMTELFYKGMNDIIAFNEGGIFNITEDSDWEEFIPKGSGQAYGAEFSYNKDVGRTTWFANYTLSWSNRQFDDINNGVTFAARYDRRHSFKISLIHRISNFSEFTFNWTYASGNRVTVPRRFAEVPLPDGRVDLRLIYEEKNNFQLPDYHRLDLGINFYSTKKWGRQKFSLGVFNAYNRRNPYFVDIVRDETQLRSFTFKQFNILPILPSLSYNLSF